MNKYSTYLAGGALLATTALASGTVSAADIRCATNTATAQTTARTCNTGATVWANAATVFTNPTATGFVANNLASTMFSAAAASAVEITNFSFVVAAGPTYTNSPVVVVTISGAEFDTNVTPAARYVGSRAQVSGGGAHTTRTSVGSSTVLPFASQLVIPISNTAGNPSYKFVEVTGVAVKNMQGLNTASTNISLGGTVQNNSQTFTFESITSQNVITSTVPALIQPSANSATITLDVTASPPFSTVGGNSTAVIGLINLSSVGTTSTDLTTVLTAGSVISTLTVAISHPSISDSATKNLTVYNGVTTLTTSAAQLSSGSVSVTVSNAMIIGADTSAANGATAGTKPVTISLNFTGSTSINSASGSQTLKITPTATAVFGAVASAQTFDEVSLSRGGLVSDVNSFTNSLNPDPSYIRVTNNGSLAGTFAIVVRNDVTGAAIGTYNSTSATSLTAGSLPSKASIQLSAAAIEAGAGLTASTSVGYYELQVQATFSGYVQHLAYTPTMGLQNLSSFRNGQGSTGTSPFIP